jgi:uncharacterized heparinase superfamily protein
MSEISKLKLFLNTIRYLKPIQVRYRVFYFLRKKLRGSLRINDSKTVYKITCTRLNLLPSIFSNSTYFSNNSFEFLNLQHNFPNKVDWDFSGYGRLWTYNLNYFEFLLQKDLSKEDGIKLIDDFIDTIDKNPTGIEPYPLSLRIMNWIKFIVYHQINPEKYKDILWAQVQLLKKQKEYHLLGNHLLENGFALLYGAYFFNDRGIYNQAKKILIKELNRQILDDGAHFELSLMYHSLMTYRVMDCYNLVICNDLFDQELKSFFKEKAELMLSFSQKISYQNGDIPLMNDAANGIAPSNEALFSYAGSLGLIVRESKLSHSGYRKLTNEIFDLCFDVGEVGPTYQPGHAHADTLSFELYIHNRPVIVDTGTSTYEVNEIRFYERSTDAHNTVSINGENSSQVWAGHRVGERAQTKITEDTDSCVIASHNGYFKRYGINHRRCIRLNETEAFIEDNVTKGEAVANFHFHPNEEIEIFGNEVKGKDFVLMFDKALSLKLITSHYSPKFNMRVDNKSLEVVFNENLITSIRLR